MIFLVLIAIVNKTPRLLLILYMQSPNAWFRYTKQLWQFTKAPPAERSVAHAIDTITMHSGVGHLSKDYSKNTVTCK